MSYTIHFDCDAYSYIEARRGDSSGSELYEGDTVERGERIWCRIMASRDVNDAHVDERTWFSLAESYVRVGNVSYHASGGEYIVQGNVTLYARSVDTRRDYRLSITKDDGCDVTVVREPTHIKNGHGVWSYVRAGTLSDGDTVKIGDCLRTIKVAAKNGYTLTQSTITGVERDVGNDYVIGKVSVVAASSMDVYELTARYTFNGVNMNVLRTESPLGNGPSGLLQDGAAIYYNDSLKVTFSLIGNATLEQATVNGVSISSGYSFKVKGDTAIIILADTGAVVHIGGESYQVFIGDGARWRQYKAYIGNGNSYDGY